MDKLGENDNIGLMCEKPFNKFSTRELYLICYIIHWYSVKTVKVSRYKLFFRVRSEINDNDDNDACYCYYYALLLRLLLLCIYFFLIINLLLLLLLHLDS